MAFFNSTAEKPLDGNSYTYAPILKAPSDQQAWGKWSQLEASRAALIAKAKTTHGGLPENWAAMSREACLQWLADNESPDGTLKKEAAMLQASMQALEKRLHHHAGGARAPQTETDLFAQAWRVQPAEWRPA